MFCRELRRRSETGVGRGTCEPSHIGARSPSCDSPCAIWTRRLRST
jgi:hypothetical protein